MALALDLALKRLGGLFRMMFLIGLDPVLWGWWILWLANVSWVGVSSEPKCGPTAGVLLFSDC
jgi:hypothetical protein